MEIKSDPVPTSELTVTVPWVMIHISLHCRWPAFWERPAILRKG